MAEMVSTRTYTYSNTNTLWLLHENNLINLNYQFLKLFSDLVSKGESYLKLTQFINSHIAQWCFLEMIIFYKIHLFSFENKIVESKNNFRAIVLWGVFLSGIVLFSLWPLTKENKSSDKTLSYPSQICDLQLSYNNLMQKLSILKRLRNFSLSVTELIEKKMYGLKIGHLKKNIPWRKIQEKKTANMSTFSILHGTKQNIRLRHFLWERVGCSVMWYLYNGGINFSAFYWESFVISDHQIHFDEKLLDQTKSCSNQDIATAAAVKSDCAHCIFVYTLSNESYKK